MFAAVTLAAAAAAMVPVTAAPVTATPVAVTPTAAKGTAAPVEKPAPVVNRRVWGKLPDGREVSLFTLENGRGLRVRMCELGAAIVSIEVPDRAGKRTDVVLGYDDLAGYAADGSAMGVVVGRYANRIAGAKFTLDGKVFSLAANNAPGGVPCSLHGGRRGFNRQLWRGEILAGDGTGGGEIRSGGGDGTGGAAVRFRYRSADGEEGFPGNLDAGVTYSLGNDNSLRIVFFAKTDKPTPLNLTQHTYFNLAGGGGGDGGGASSGTGDILNHTLQIRADAFLPVNAGLIPTGEFAPVAGTPFDFREPRRIGECIAGAHPQLRLGGGYDHCFVLRGKTEPKTGGTPDVLTGTTPDAVLHAPGSGRSLCIFTTEPGLQLYTGNGLAGVQGKNGARYPRNGGVALETQHFPDSPNQQKFPSTILRPNETFSSTTIFQFSTE